MAGDQMGIGTTDGNCTNPGDYLVPAGYRLGNLFNGELVRLCDDQSFHGLSLYSQITASGSTIDPVAPLIFSGSITKRNS